MILFCIGAIVGVVATVVVAPTLPFILWALDFIDLEGRPMTPHWLDRWHR